MALIGPLVFPFQQLRQFLVVLGAVNRHDLAPVSEMRVMHPLQPVMLQYLDAPDPGRHTQSSTLYWMGLFPEKKT
jgi:hypothetical protein